MGLGMNIGIIYMMGGILRDLIDIEYLDEVGLD